MVCIRCIVVNTVHKSDNDDGITIIINTTTEKLQKYTELKDKLRRVRQLQAVYTVTIVHIGC